MPQQDHLPRAGPAWVLSSGKKLCLGPSRHLSTFRKSYALSKKNKYRYMSVSLYMCIYIYTCICGEDHGQAGLGFVWASARPDPLHGAGWPGTGARGVQAVASIAVCPWLLR